MSEMLGNHQFMIHNFKAAARMFEAAIQNTAQTKPLRKKLIVCYTQMGEIEKVFELLIPFLDEDLDFLITVNPMEVECPCPELIHDIEHSLHSQQDLQTNYVKLGIYWLYLDIGQSVKYLELARNQSHFKAEIEVILTHLYERIKAEKFNLVN